MSDADGHRRHQKKKTRQEKRQKSHQRSEKKQPASSNIAKRMIQVNLEYLLILIDFDWHEKFKPNMFHMSRAILCFARLPPLQPLALAPSRRSRMVFVVPRSLWLVPYRIALDMQTI